MTVVGVDLGGTKIVAAAVGRDGRLRGEAVRPTPASAGPGAVLDAVADAVRQAARGAVLTGVGVGAAGAVDSARGVIVGSTDVFARWVGTDIPAGLAARLGEVPVQVRNDVDAHLLGETWLGAAPGARSALMIAAGTGIGGGILIDGRLLAGARHHAGDIGHLPVPGADGLPCPCGRTGHLEAIAAGPAVHRRYLALGGDPAARDSRAVAARAGGDALASRALADAAAALGRAVAGLAAALDPEVVIVGGGLSQAGPAWWDPFETALRAELVDGLAGLPVRASTLGPAAAVLGAARWFIEGAHGRPGEVADEKGIGA